MSKQKQLQCVVYWPPRKWHVMYVIWGLWRQKDLWKNVGNSWLLNFDVITILGWEMVNILECLQAFGDNLKSPPRPPSPLSWVCWHCWNIPRRPTLENIFSDFATFSFDISAQLATRYITHFRWIGRIEFTWKYVWIQKFLCGFKCQQLFKVTFHFVSLTSLILSTLAVPAIH